MMLLGLIALIVVTIGIVVAILLFERPRAERIERDLGEDARRRRREP
jgi:hypothetical protein